MLILYVTIAALLFVRSLPRIVNFWDAVSRH